MLQNNSCNLQTRMKVKRYLAEKRIYKTVAHCGVQGYEPLSCLYFIHVTKGIFVKHKK